MAATQDFFIAGNIRIVLGLRRTCEIRNHINSWLSNLTGCSNSYHDRLFVLSQSFMVTALCKLDESLFGHCPAGYILRIERTFKRRGGSMRTFLEKQAFLR